MMIPTFFMLLKLVKLSDKFVLLCAIIFSLFLFPEVTVAQTPPYPPSSLFESITFDLSSDIQHGHGSDQWPMTWAANNNIYTAWGDGWGWSGVGPQSLKKSIGVSAITGNPPGLNGTDLWGDGPGFDFGKPEALISYNGNIYMFWIKGESYPDTDNTHSASAPLSNPSNWTLEHSTRAFPSLPDGLRVRGICQFGKGYADAVDNYVYVYFGWSRSKEIFLARALKSDIFNASAYLWFMSINSDGSAQWGNFANRNVVFYDDNRFLWHIGVTYNKPLNRYFLSKSHYTTGGVPAEMNYHTKGIGIFDAPAPWGPWTTVHYSNSFKDNFTKFTYFFPQKFSSSDGLTMWMAWSGHPEYDSVNFTKATLVLKQTSPDTTPPANPEGLAVQ